MSRRAPRKTVEGTAWKCALILAAIVLFSFCHGSPPNLDFAKATGFGAALNK